MENKDLESIETNQTTSELNPAVTDILHNIISAATTKPTLKEKLKSRKFWICIAGAAGGICALVGIQDDLRAIICFIILEIISVLGYCITEGAIDKTRAESLGKAVSTLINMLAEKTQKEAPEEHEENIDIGRREQ